MTVHLGLRTSAPARGSERGAPARADASRRPRSVRRGRSRAGAAHRARRGARARLRRVTPRSEAWPLATAGHTTTSPSSIGRIARVGRWCPGPRPPWSGWRPDGGSSSSIGNASTSVGPLDPRNRSLSSAIGRRVDEEQRHLGVGPEPLDHPLLVEHELREPHPARRRRRRRRAARRRRTPSGTSSVIVALVPAGSSWRPYASTMSWTMRWRTTSPRAELDEHEAVDAVEHVAHLQQARAMPAVGKVDLGDVAGDDRTSTRSRAG